MNLAAEAHQSVVFEAERILQRGNNSLRRQVKSLVLSETFRKL